MIKREIMFIVIGILLLLAIIGFVFYSINFLVKHVKTVLDTDQSSQSEKTIRFNLEELKKLGLTQ